MNPLISVGSLKDNEIDQKIQELSRKYFMTQNPEMKNQILNILNIYKEELSTRRAAAWEKQSQKNNKELDNLININ
jgi:FKBP-type peptidyl-prolyl cis-trans isomerase (trigger factor)